MSSDTINIFEVVDVEQIDAAGRPTYARGTQTLSRTTQVVEQSVDAVQSQMTEFIEGVQKILSKGAQVAGEFEMKTVEVQAQIGVEGKIGFMGTGASASGSSQIKIVFARRSEDN